MYELEITEVRSLEGTGAGARVEGVAGEEADWELVGKEEGSVIKAGTEDRNEEVSKRESEEEGKARG